MQGMRWLPMAALVILLAFGGSRAEESPRYMIYLHGRIVQETQDLRPVHPRFGAYEVEAILDSLRSRGFTVAGELRPKEITVSAAADHVVAQIQDLLDSGVPADHVTVVGGSMGGGIALLASARLQNQDVRFCTLGVCLAGNVERLVAQEGRGPSGSVLAIREASDAVTQGCPAWVQDEKSGSTLTAREIVIETGLEHGFLYRPLPIWIEPVVAWAQSGAASLDAGKGENPPGGSPRGGRE